MVNPLPANAPGLDRAACLAALPLQALVVLATNGCRGHPLSTAAGGRRVTHSPLSGGWSPRRDFHRAALPRLRGVQLSLRAWGTEPPRKSDEAAWPLAAFNAVDRECTPSAYARYRHLERGQDATWPVRRPEQP